MFWTIGCLYGASSVAIGAFGAHGLKNRIADPSKLANWSTAAQYQVDSCEHKKTHEHLTHSIVAHSLGCSLA